MSTKRTTLNPGLKTGLIILGIILAVILTWHSSSLVLSVIPLFQGPVADMFSGSGEFSLSGIGKFLADADLTKHIVHSINN